MIRFSFVLMAYHWLVFSEAFNHSALQAVGIQHPGKGIHLLIPIWTLRIRWSRYGRQIEANIPAPLSIGGKTGLSPLAVGPLAKPPSRQL
ncbi:hypothetical protein C8R43DRAFT_984280 [Mycena crocata]|nr:hypothetical protein C8R43DRAFT_984280 [Mycena crocata]